MSPLNWDTFFDCSNDCFAILSKDLELIDFNASWNRILGYPTQGLRKKNVTLLMPQDAKKEFLEALTKQRHCSSEPIRIETRLKTIDDQIRYFEFSMIEHPDSWSLIAKDKTEKYHYKFLLDESSELIWEVEFPSFKLSYMNDRRAQELYGRDPKEFYTDSSLWQKVIHPDDQSKVQELTQKLIDGQTHLINIEYRIIRSDQSERWVQNRSIRITDNNGRLIRLQGKVFDITDEKLKRIYDENLRKHYDALLETGRLGAWTWHIPTNQVTYDQRWCDIIGTKLENTPQDFETWASRLHPDDKESAIQSVKDYVQGKTKTHEHVHRLKHADGSWVWTIGRSRISERDENGNPVRVSGTQLNIDSYKRTELLNESIQRIAKIGGWQLDTETHQTFWTPETYRIHGVPVGTPTDTFSEISFYLGDDQDKIKNYVFRSIESGVPYQDQFKIKDTLGNEKWVLVTGEPVLNSEGKVVRLQGTFQDISEIKNYESKLNTLIETETHLKLQAEQKNQELKKFNEQFGLILNYSPIVIFECQANKNWTISFVSKQIENLTGYPDYEFIHDQVRPYNSVIHPEDQETVSDIVHKAIQNNSEYDIRYRILHKDGSIRWVWERGSLLNNGNLIGVMIDITEKIQLQEEQKKALTELKKFFSVSIDMMCIAGFDGYYKKVNPAFTKILGYSEEELLSRPITSFVHPDDVKKTAEEFPKLLSGDLTSGFQNRYITKDGNIKILQWFASTDADKNLIYGAARDVTDFVYSKTELEQTLKAINASAIVVITDKNGVITEVNENFCKISGYERSELLGKTHKIVNSGIHPKSYFKEMWSTLHNGKTWTGEIKNRNKNGKIYTVQTVITPLLDKNNKIDRFLAIRFDITKQKEIERKLEEAQSVGKIGSWVYDTHKNEITWSKQMYQMFDMKNHVQIPPSFEEHQLQIHPDDREIWRNAVEQCLKTGKPYRIRFRSLMPEGPLWLEAIGNAKTDKKGEIYELSGTCQDIHELVHTEEELKLERTKALQAAKLASLGEMSAGIAHEINNPLAIIAGNMSLIQKFKSDEEKLNSKIASMQKATERIAQIIKGLQKFSRQQVSQDFKAHSLKSLMNEVLVLTQIRSNKFTTPVTVDFQSEPIIYGNEIELEQVFLNLVNNAIDAVKKQENRWVKIKVFDDKNEAVIQIIDSGHGIPKKVAEKLFQPFFTTKPVGEGTGLGLSISKGILDEHQATIEVLPDTPNTCFEIRFKKVEFKAKAA